MFCSSSLAQNTNLNGSRKMDCGTSTTTCYFSHSPFWVQVWGLPFEMMDDGVGKELGNSLGRFIESDKRIGQADQAKFMRIRVDLLLEKSL